MDAFSKIKLKYETDTLLANPGLLEELNKYTRSVKEEIWTLFYKAKADGLFIVKILFFKKDFSDVVESCLAQWIGRDPNIHRELL